MRSTLRDDLTTALKARDRVAVAALRSALAAIENAEAVPAVGGSLSASAGSTEVPRRELSDDEVRAIVEREVIERSDAAADYRRRGREDVVDRLLAEAEVLRRRVVTPRGVSR